MKLNELLEEIKLGTEVYKEEKNKEVLLESFDEDLENYKTSKIFSLLESKLVNNINEESSVVIRALRKVKNKIEMLEDKEDISTAYASMKMDSLVEDYNNFADLISKKKIQRMVDKDALSHAVALIEFTINNLSKISERQPDLAELPETFEPLVKKEYKLISENIG